MCGASCTDEAAEPAGQERIEGMQLKRTVYLETYSRKASYLALGQWI